MKPEVSLINASSEGRQRTFHWAVFCAESPRSLWRLFAACKSHPGRRYKRLHFSARLSFCEEPVDSVETYGVLRGFFLTILLFSGEQECLRSADTTVHTSAPPSRLYEPL